MGASQLAHFREILSGYKNELTQDVGRTVQMMQDEATVFADPNDRATQESDLGLELRNRDRERKLSANRIRPSHELMPENTDTAKNVAPKLPSSAWKRDPLRPCALNARHWTKSANGKWPNRRERRPVPGKLPRE